MNDLATQYSLFEYQYRDGGNFKSSDFVILEGTSNHDIQSSLESCLFEGMWFIAKQIGLPDLFENVKKWGPSDLDHPWHEFVELRPALEAEIKQNPCSGTLADLVEAFQKAKNKWEPDIN